MRSHFVVLVFSLFSWTAFASESREVEVTCALPNDQQIWPLPAPKVSDVAETEFVSVELLLRVRVGNFFQTTERAVYRVIGSHGGFADSEVSFIFHDNWPTPESHIQVKKLDSPFAPKTKARFWMSKRRDDPVWDIQTYEIWNEHFHRKPGA
jgi:hypothetical protein